MADPDSSTKRLDAAIARLETAVEKRGGGVELAGAAQQRLEKELAELRTDFEHLRETSSGVSAQLDATIGRLKGVLGDGV